MGCFGDGEKGPAEESQKWAYVTLPDFRANGALTFLSYVWLWFLAIVAVAVYAADTFTAVNLLAFDKWDSKIQPAIPFKYSKWIFAICIIISWALCAFEWIRAIRVIRRGGVAESYMDPLAVNLQSMRPQGGWKRFLVFAELTKSKKGVDYIALFVYFKFKGAIRVVLAEGARQVVNALTLYSVMKADFLPTGKHAATSGHSSIEQFFVNIKTLAESDKEQAVVIGLMLFTLVIWIVSALSLILALVMYILFLWHYVPQKDGRLSIYCRRKIDRRLEKIVGQKVKQAIEDQEKKRLKEEAKAVKNGDAPTTVRKPTLPKLGGMTPNIGADGRLPESGLVRQDTQTSLPPHASNPPTRTHTPGLQREATLPDVLMQNQRPGMPFRSDTEASALSNTSYASNAPLLGNATEMGYVNEPGPRPSLDRNMSSSTYTSRPLPNRTTTQTSQRSQASSQYRPPMSRAQTFGSEQYRSSPPPQAMNSLSRQYSNQSVHSPPMHQNIQNSTISRPFGQPIRQNTQNSTTSRPFGQPTRQNTQDSTTSRPFGQPIRQNTQESTARPEDFVLQRQTTQTSFHRPLSPQLRPGTGMSHDIPYHTPSPGPEQQGYEMTIQPTRMATPLDQAPFPAEAYGRTVDLTRVISCESPFRSPPPSAGLYELNVQPTRVASPARSFSRPPPPSSAGGYVAYKPSFASNPLQDRPMELKRNMTSPFSTVAHLDRDVPQRSATAPPEAGAYDDLIDDYGESPRTSMEMIPPHFRSATAGPEGRYGGNYGW